VDQGAEFDRLSRQTRAQFSPAGPSSPRDRGNRASDPVPRETQGHCDATRQPGRTQDTPDRRYVCWARTWPL